MGWLRCGKLTRPGAQNPCFVHGHSALSLPWHTPRRMRGFRMDVAEFYLDPFLVKQGVLGPNHSKIFPTQKPGVLDICVLDPSGFATPAESHEAEEKRAYEICGCPPSTGQRSSALRNVKKPVLQAGRLKTSRIAHSLIAHCTGVEDKRGPAHEDVHQLRSLKPLPFVAVVPSPKWDQEWSHVSSI